MVVVLGGHGCGFGCWRGYWLFLDGGSVIIAGIIEYRIIANTTVIVNFVIVINATITTKMMIVILASIAITIISIE